MVNLLINALPPNSEKILNVSVTLAKV